MKRFLAILLLLILIGGTVFFFGWVQLQIPAGTHAVIFTKTNGWESQPIAPGTFVWRWQRLIPTNLSLYTFPAESKRLSITVSGSLPAGETLSALLDENDAFSYRLALSVSFRVSPQSLPQLAQERDLRPDTIDDWYDQIESQIEQIATQALVTVMEDAESTSAEQTLARIGEEIRTRTASSFPELELQALTATELSLPAAELYQRARELAIGVMEARAQSLREAADQLAEQRTQDENQLDRLERYGQILDEYPVLLEYFRVGREINGDPLNIESLIDEPGE